MKALAAIIAAMLVVAAIAVAAANAGRAESNGSPEIVLEEMRFTPNRIDAKAGETISVRLVNRGNQRHDLNFPSLHMPGLGGVEAILEPGETRTISLTFDTPGTHTFICTLPGHAAAGMTGAAFVR